MVKQNVCQEQNENKCVGIQNSFMLLCKSRFLRYAFKNVDSLGAYILCNFPNLPVLFFILKSNLEEALNGNQNAK